MTGRCVHSERKTKNHLKDDHEPAAVDQLVEKCHTGRRLVDDGGHVHGCGKGRRDLCDQVVEVGADESSAVAVVEKFLWKM